MSPSFKNILYCTMIGPNSPYIFKHALALAELSGGKIHIIHVMEALSQRQEELVEHFVSRSLIEELHKNDVEEAKERLKKRLIALCPPKNGDGISDMIASISIVAGKPTEQILKKSDEVNADVIVMGATSTHSLFEKVVGYTAQNIVSNSKVPVLTVQVPEGFQLKGVSDI
ncbi:MAG: hypothetical protein C0609_01935 [Deltaproteobacteria bacterium]|nr:MAG: hypothetical protein C0609_01935 [Deltaproteobacteria bacterium]